MKILDNFKRATLETKRLSILRDEELERLKKEHNKVHYGFQDQIRKIQSEQNEAQRKYENTVEKVKSTASEEQQPHWDTIKNMEVLFKLSQVYKEGNYKPEAPEETLETLYNDEFKSCHISIGSNRKPKNKYTLYVECDSKFRWTFYETRKDWEIKCAPKEEDLEKYWEKNREKILKQIENKWLKAQLSYEKKYKQVVKLFETEEWQKAYLDYLKDYYENQVTQDANDYKAVMEQLKVFDTNKEDLPLLIGEIVTEEGQKFLTERLQGV